MPPPLVCTYCTYQVEETGGALGGDKGEEQKSPFHTQEKPNRRRRETPLFLFFSVSFPLSCVSVSSGDEFSLGLLFFRVWANDSHEISVRICKKKHAFSLVQNLPLPFFFLLKLF